MTFEYIYAFSFSNLDTHFFFIIQEKSLSLLSGPPISVWMEINYP